MSDQVLSREQAENDLELLRKELEQLGQQRNQLDAAIRMQQGAIQYAEHVLRRMDEEPPVNKTQEKQRRVKQQEPA
jgi:multidrug resistance efflux pump